MIEVIPLALTYTILALVQCGPVLCRNYFSALPAGVTRNGTCE